MLQCLFTWSTDGGARYSPSPYQDWCSENGIEGRLSKPIVFSLAQLPHLEKTYLGSRAYMITLCLGVYEHLRLEIHLKA